MCLNQCFVALDKFSNNLPGYENGDIGRMMLPEILPHTVEVFIDSEKVQTNLGEKPVPQIKGGFPNKFINKKFLAFNRDYTPEDASATTYE